MKKICICTLILMAAIALTVLAQDRPPLVSKEVKLKDIRLRDVCVLTDKATGTYYMVGPGRSASVVQYTSKDLVNWVGPKEIYRAPQGLWPDASITAVWAPELHAYNGKYYIFLT